MLIIIANRHRGLALHFARFLSFFFRGKFFIDKTRVPSINEYSTVSWSSRFYLFLPSTSRITSREDDNISPLSQLQGKHRDPPVFPPSFFLFLAIFLRMRMLCIGGTVLSPVFWTICVEQSMSTTVELVAFFYIKKDYWSQVDNKRGQSGGQGNPYLQKRGCL